MSHPILNIVPEYPEGEHISEEVQEAAMHEHAGQQR